MLGIPMFFPDCMQLIITSMDSKNFLPRVKMADSMRAKKSNLFYLLLFSFLAQIVSSSSSFDGDEATALFSWKSGFFRSTDIRLNSWELQENSSLCSSWFGVSCIHGTVNRLNLTSLNIQGTLQNFPFLSLLNLEHLNLSINEFSGGIPPQISSLSKLHYLDFSRNQFFGKIPPEISLLTNLRTLHLQENRLFGSIPEEFGKLLNMVSLRVDVNQLNGSIPVSFGNLVQLDSLYVGHNMLSGSIPREMGNMVKLTTLSMDTNQLTGELPEELFMIPFLQMICALKNNLSGPIPRTFKTCKTLKRVRFDRNQLTGNLSQDFGVYPELYYISLNGNNFYGELDSNWFSNWLILHQNLECFSISNNKITGFLPPAFGNMTKLGVLDLSSNQLTGQIPKELGKLKSLLTLYLDNNQLSGEIPQELGLLTGLSSLNLSKNLLHGSVPESIGNCRKLFSLSLSNNFLSHGIPGYLGKLNQLTLLDLSHNFLAGEIPPEFSSLESLETLNLSHNLLSGFIPNEMSEMPGTVEIDVSYNQLEGPIPSGKAFVNGTYEHFIGNKGLCGSMKGLEPCELVQRKRERKLDLIIVLPLVICLIILLFSIVGICLWTKARTRTSRVCDADANIVSMSTFGEHKITYESILKVTEEFNPRFRIGEGHSGSVYKAALPCGNTVAVKRFHFLSESTFDHPKSFLNEITAFVMIKHRNIVKLHGYYSSTKHTFLVYEYVERGSLARVLSMDNEAQGLDWRKRINIIKGVSLALSYLHHDCLPPIVHRDISSKNILLDLDNEAHVSDFGTAKLLERDSSNWSALAGTYGYFAPEVAYTRKVTEKFDVYSFGVLVLEILKGIHPGESISRLIECSTPALLPFVEFLDHRLPYPSEEDEESLFSILELGKACLNAEPQYRPTMYFVSNKLSVFS